jgi:hypothetical protein
VAERSDYRETSRHADVLGFIEALKDRRPWIRVESMGRSAMGQEMPLLILGEKRPDRPTLLVIANIHAGEVEGKEALLMLARDLPESVTQKLTLLFIPNYNPDGNDRIDPKNRALDLERLEGQIGPEAGVGTRYTAQGINLNRDYMKLEAVESRHLSGLYGAWRPHLTVDCHTTDGSIHGFWLTYDTSHIPTAPCEFVRTEFLPEVGRRLDRRTGIKTFFYGNFVDEQDLSKGWVTYSHLPRYGSHYRGLTGRMDILLETYSYIPFRERVVTTMEILKDIFDLAAARSSDLLRLCEEAEGERPDPVGIAYGKPGAIGECEILAWDPESQRARKVPGRTVVPYRMPHLARFVPSRWVARPAAYLLREDQPQVAEKLGQHHVVLKRLREAWEGEAELYRVLGIGQEESPDVGSTARKETVVTARAERAFYRAEAGDYLIPTDQPLGTLASYLLEPESDDGLARWGYFDPSLKPGALYPVARLLGELPPV